jgi:hypothetical protein
VKVAGDTVTISFVSKGYCDATVAIENAEGKIVRHLASGVLGRNAPAPFRKNSLEQTVVWDGKDDRGKYVEDRDACRVRVSLGLKPRFERTLFWSAGRRNTRKVPCIVARPEGVYYFQGGGWDQLTLFDHDGRYVRTIYPFPANRLQQIKGLWWHRYPQDGKKLPVKANYCQTTFLKGGGNAYKAVTYRPKEKRYFSSASAQGMGGSAASTMAVANGRIALADLRLSRLGTDGSSGGLPLTGPKVFIVSRFSGVHAFGGGPQKLVPRSSAFSPDGRTLYLTGYLFDYKWLRGGLNVVLRTTFAGNEKPDVFVGSVKRHDVGTGNKRFAVATDVDCDAKGRVYVADYLNDRVQVFTPDGTHVANLPTAKPIRVQVNRRNGEIWVASWNLAVHERSLTRGLEKAGITVPRKVPAALRRYHSLDDPKLLALLPLPLKRYQIYKGSTGHEYEVHVDTHVHPARVWIVPWGPPGNRGTPWLSSCVHVYEVGERRLKRIRILGEEARTRLKTLEFRARSRPYVNPANGRLYLQATSTAGTGGGGGGGHKGFEKLVEINPETAACRITKLPMRPEDIAFAPDGLCVMRGMNYLARFDPGTWREVPWDYGEQHVVGFFGDYAAVSVLPARGVNWHMGGLDINALGNVAISTYIRWNDKDRRGIKNVHGRTAAEEKLPRLYPGRRIVGMGPVIHVFDRHGKMVCDDALPGLGITHGVKIDNDNNVYVGGTATVRLGEEPYFNDMTGSIIKAKPGKARLVGGRNTPVPLTTGRQPDRPCDFNDKTWVEGAEWVFGGVGWCGKDRSAYGCDCWNIQFDVDEYARTFAPEIDRYSVVALDANGNVVLRMGRYGNIDEGRPLIKDGGPPAPRPIGSDELTLFHGAYVAVDTDRRLYVVDNGNHRVASVRLSYHATETVALKDVPEAK